MLLSTGAAVRLQRFDCRSLIRWARRFPSTYVTKNEPSWNLPPSGSGKFSTRSHASNITFRVYTRTFYRREYRCNLTSTLGVLAILPRGIDKGYEDSILERATFSSRANPRYRGCYIFPTKPRRLYSQLEIYFITSLRQTSKPIPTIHTRPHPIVLLSCRRCLPIAHEIPSIAVQPFDLVAAVDVHPELPHELVLALPV